MTSEKILETSLDSLLNRIQTEGIQKAEDAAAEIIEAAQQQAESIVAEARKEVKILNESNTLALKRREENTNNRLRQSARDLVLHVRAEIISLFERILLHQCHSSLQGKNLAAVILKTVTAWQTGSEGSLDLEILVNEQEKPHICDDLLAELQEQAEEGLEVKGHPDIAAGFRIGKKGSHLYYDFTDRAIAETLGQYLRPEVAALLDKID